MDDEGPLPGYEVVAVKWRRYTKTIIAVLGAVVAAVVLVGKDGRVSWYDGFVIFNALLTSLGVYVFPNAQGNGETE